MEASLYIHVPFCASACDYCDFYSVTVKPGDIKPERYIAALLSEGERLLKTCLYESAGTRNADNPFADLPEMSGREGSSLRIPSIFIGGGTPSILGPSGAGKLLHGLSDLIKKYSSSPPEEITIESNPNSVDEAFLSAIREGGVTRLSMGIQTFYSPSRQAVNLLGEESMLFRKLMLASEYFPGSFSVDLISGLPYQDEKILLNDIAGILLYKPAHVSLYALTARLKATLPAPDQDEADRLWLCGRDTLEKSGFHQYEVSNFCPEGKESLHNIRYWRMYNWLALGPGASGTIIDNERGRGFRYTIPQDVESWLAAKGCWFSQKRKFAPKVEELDTFTLIKESILMGFRYLEGPDEGLFYRRFHLYIKDLIPKTIRAWRTGGFLQPKRMALTKEGLLFLNRFLVEAFGELDAVFSAW